MSQIVVFGAHYRRERGVPVYAYDILYEGKEYRVDDTQLRLLYDGVSLEDLDLLPLEEVVDDD